MENKQAVTEAVPRRHGRHANGDKQQAARSAGRPLEPVLLAVVTL